MEDHSRYALAEGSEVVCGQGWGLNSLDLSVTNSPQELHRSLLDCGALQLNAAASKSYSVASLAPHFLGAVELLGYRTGIG